MDKQLIEDLKKALNRQIRAQLKESLIILENEIIRKEISNDTN